MQPADVPVAERLSAEAFLGVDLETYPRSAPVPALRPAARGEQWVTRTEHFLRTDPGGSWVAEQDGAMLGFATSYRRELLWLLASYAVRPGLQGAGIGKALLDAALSHGRGCLRGMLAASSDPRAFRRYRLAGFTLHPQLVLSGTVDRSALPVVEHVREGTASDFDLMDSLDRRCREAAHGVDHPVMAGMFRLLVTDRSTGSGYAYVDRDGRPLVIAADNRRTASTLMWECLASTAPGADVEVHHVTTANEWAVDVGLAARLAVRTEGYLALRGMKPPAPYLHHGAYL